MEVRLGYIIARRKQESKKRYDFEHKGHGDYLEIPFDYGCDVLLTVFRDGHTTLSANNRMYVTADDLRHLADVTDRAKNWFKTGGKNE